MIYRGHSATPQNLQLAGETRHMCRILVGQLLGMWLHERLRKGNAKMANRMFQGIKLVYMVVVIVAIYCCMSTCQTLAVYFGLVALMLCCCVFLFILELALPLGRQFSLTYTT